VTTVEIGSALLAQGIASVNFFNGRVLTAEDLRDEQAAQATRRLQLGRAIGEGVVSGLFVARGVDGTSLTVSQGLAVAPSGDALELTTGPVNVPLVGAASVDSSSAGGSFAPCDDAGGPGGIAGQGVYLLVACPASDKVGEAPSVGPDTAGVATDCGPRYTVDGLAFRLLRLDVAGLAGAAGLDAGASAILASAQTGDVWLLRNVLAHLLLGTVPSRALFVDPFRVGVLGGPSTAGALDDLRAAGTLLGREVPLAVLVWSDAGVRLVDGWAVRRSVVRGGATAPAWTALAGRRRAAEGEAALLQFQEQIAAMTAPGALASPLPDVRAVDHFRFLPAVGLVPVAGADGTGGFDEDEFFATLAVAPVAAIEGARLESLVRASLSVPPVDVTAGELLFRYRVRENAAAADSGDPVRAFIVFSSSALPYQGPGKLKILAVLPEGPLEVGQAIEVRGVEFGVLAGTATVTFDAVGAEPGAGSTDERLLVTVPDLGALPAEGREVALRVDNGRDSDEVTVTVAPPPPTTPPAIDVHWRGVGQGRTAEYRVLSRLDTRATVALEARATPDDVNVEFVIPGPPHNLPDLDPGEAGFVALRVTALGVRDEFLLRLSARAGTVTGSDVRRFTRADPPRQVDKNAHLEDFGLVTQPEGLGALDTFTSEITLDVGPDAMLHAAALIRSNDDYTATLSLHGGSGWTVAFDRDLPGFRDPETVHLDRGVFGPRQERRHPLRVVLTRDSGAERGLMTLTIAAVDPLGVRVPEVSKSFVLAGVE
jgi:hypothetical protein